MKVLHDLYKSQNKEDEFKLWFNMNYVEDTIDTITVSVASSFLKLTMEKKGNFDIVLKKLKEITGQNDISLKCIIKEEKISKSENSDSKKSDESENKKKTEEPKEEKKSEAKNLVLKNISCFRKNILLIHLFLETTVTLLITLLLPLLRNLENSITRFFFMVDLG